MHILSTGLVGGCSPIKKQFASQRKDVVSRHNMEFLSNRCLRLACVGAQDKASVLPKWVWFNAYWVRKTIGLIRTLLTFSGVPTAPIVQWQHGGSSSPHSETLGQH